MPFAKINGTELYYEVHGQGSPLVLAHGGASNHISWYRQVVGFRGQHTVVTYDQRGFGFSEENGDYSVSAVDGCKWPMRKLKKNTMPSVPINSTIISGPPKIACPNAVRPVI